MRRNRPKFSSGKKIFSVNVSCFIEILTVNGKCFFEICTVNGKYFATGKAIWGF